MVLVLGLTGLASQVETVDASTYGNGVQVTIPKKMQGTGTLMIVMHIMAQRSPLLNILLMANQYLPRRLRQLVITSMVELLTRRTLIR